LIAAGISSALASNEHNIQIKKEDNTQPLSPVSLFKNDISPQKALEYRKNYRSKDFLINGDLGVYFLASCRHIEVKQRVKLKLKKSKSQST